MNDLFKLPACYLANQNPLLLTLALLSMGLLLLTMWTPEKIETYLDYFLVPKLTPKIWLKFNYRIKEDLNDFRRSQNLKEGELVFKKVLQLRNQLVIAAEKTLAENKIRPPSSNRKI